MILLNLFLIGYVYLVTLEFDTMVGILLWLSSLSVRILVYFLTPEHEIGQWCRECFGHREFSKQNRNNDGMGSMGSGIELQMPQRSAGDWRPPDCMFFLCIFFFFRF